MSIEGRARAWLHQANSLEAVVEPKIRFAIRRAFYFASENLTTADRASWWLRDRTAQVMRLHLKSSLQQFGLLEQRQEEKQLIDKLSQENREWIERHALATADWLADEQRQKFAEVIAAGNTLGLPLNVIAQQLINAGLRVSQVKATFIARNETLKAADLAQEQVIKLLGRMPRAKAWVNMSDEVVRDTHNSVTALPNLNEGNYPTTDFNGHFNCGDVICSGPRDAALRAADPALWINCRCYLAYLD